MSGSNLLLSPVGGVYPHSSRYSRVVCACGYMFVLSFLHTLLLLQHAARTPVLMPPHTLTPHLSCMPPACPTTQPRPSPAPHHGRTPSSHSSAPSTASPSPMSPCSNPPRQISVPGTCCCRASRTNSRSTACDTRVLSHSSTRRWQRQRIQHRICDVTHVLDVQPLDAQRRVRQVHQASSFNSGTASGPRPAAGWLAGRVGAHGM